jgi:anti-sigma B factor antagonist
MALKITDREVDGVTVLALDGRIVLREETTQLREKVKGLFAAGKKRFVLDLAKVTFIDSSGLGTLVAVHSSARTGGAAMRLCNLGSRFNDLLQITKLYTVFDVSATETDAVRAMAKTASAS